MGQSFIVWRQTATFARNVSWGAEAVLSLLWSLGFGSVGAAHGGSSQPQEIVTQFYQFSSPAGHVQISWILHGATVVAATPGEKTRTTGANRACSSSPAVGLAPRPQP